MPAAQLVYIFNVATCFDLKESSSCRWYKIHRRIYVLFLNIITIVHI